MHIRNYWRRDNVVLCYSNLLLSFQVRMMEQRLAAADWTPSEASEQVTTLTTAVKERQQVISKLETEVEEQVS